MFRRLGSLALLGLVLLIGACGDEERSDLLTEAEVRECLANARIAVRAPDATTKEGAPGYAPLYLETAPDLTAFARDGTGVDVVIQGSTQRARRTASHVKGALESLGSFAAASNRVVQGENVVAVFRRRASPQDRDGVMACLSS